MRDTTRTFGLALATGLVVGVVASVVAHVVGHPIRPWLASALALTAALLLAGLYESWLRVAGPEPQPPPRPERAGLTDRKRGGLDLTVRMLERATSDPDRFEALRARLTRLTEERLLTRRGIDVRADPDRARALVGDGLVELFAGRPRRPPDGAQLEEWITRLEAL